jgi:endonuclease I
VVAAEVEVVDFKNGPMKTLGFLVLLILFTFQVTGQAPAGYYDEAYGLDGTELQAALHEIIKDHQVQTYASLYNHFQSADRKPNQSVWDMYSDVPGVTPPYVYYYNSGHECGNYNGEGQCYNREHSWPQSWFGGSILPMHTDLFHLYPTDGYVNNRRANYPFGEVSNATWTSMNGSKVGANTTAGYTGVVFEPIDAYKGDFARSYFYMSVRYYGQDSNWPGSPQTDGSQLKPWALAMMMEWHENDPVSEKEINRNNAVYAIQQNRNPFIDYPEFVDAIWGDPSGLFSRDKNTTISVYPIPAVDYCYISFTRAIDSYPNMSVYNHLGQLVHVNYSLENGSVILETGELSKGLYIVRISIESNPPIMVKVLK